MATKRHQSWVASDNPTPKLSQNNPPRSQQGKERSLDNPPPHLIGSRFWRIKSNALRSCSLVSWTTSISWPIILKQGQGRSPRWRKDLTRARRTLEGGDRNKDWEGQGVFQHVICIIAAGKEAGQLEKEIAALKLKQGESQGTVVNQHLSLEIMAAVSLKRLCSLAIKPYAGTISPMDHLDLFTSHMIMQDASNAMWCRVFLVTLERHARA